MFPKLIKNVERPYPMLALVLLVMLFSIARRLLKSMFVYK